MKRIKNLLRNMSTQVGIWYRISKKIYQGSGFTGVGNATNWVSWDTNLHLEGTARIVRRISRRNEAEELAARKLDRWPWLQTELGIAEDT